MNQYLFFMNLLSDLILWSAPIPLLIFIILYGWRFPWKSTRLGKDFMLQKISWITLMGFWGISRIGYRSQGMTELSAFPGQPELRVLVYGFVVFGFWRFAIFLMKTYREAKKSKCPPTLTEEIPIENPNKGEK